MAAGSYDLYIEQGSTFTKTFTWYNSSKVAIDLTNYTAIMQIREDLEGDIIASSASDPVSITLTLGGVAGTIAVTIDHAYTAGFNFDTAVWDINLTYTPTGVVTRLLEGEVKLSKGVTRTGDETYVTLSTLVGTTEGDFIRWDDTLGTWKVVSEPLAFDEILLTPKASSTGAEGTVFYSSTYKALMVAVEA